MKSMNSSALQIFALVATTIWSGAALAGEVVDYTNHWIGYLCLLIFSCTYVLVIVEESLHLRKSKPMMLAAGGVWVLVALAASQHDNPQLAREAVQHNLLEYGELFLFLLVAMTYINAMDERGVFGALRSRLVSKGFSLRQIYWITGALAFVMSPIADNLTTALLMAAVLMAVGGSNKKFVTVGCINIVVAANAGGAFSPFGDITTLMVWQKGHVQFLEFFSLFVPSLVNWLLPAVVMSLTLPNGKPEAIDQKVNLKRGAWITVMLFLITVLMAVSAHSFLHMPPVLGMMLGLGLLNLYARFLQRTPLQPIAPDSTSIANKALALESSQDNLDVYGALQRAEWDTLMFFYGIILCVGGLGVLGYLELVSVMMYGDLGATTANIGVGILSALIDNIPVMFAVLAMSPEMDHGQWLLVTLTAGVGGSLLSVGSAAGVAVMGQARGIYTFFAHLKWTWAIAIGYIASIGVHFMINADKFAT